MRAPGSGGLSAARDGLAAARELADGSSEHHPLWPLLHRGLAVAEAALDGWESGLAPGARGELAGHAAGIAEACGRLPPDEGGGAA